MHRFYITALPSHQEGQKLTARYKARYDSSEDLKAATIHILKRSVSGQEYICFGNVNKKMSEKIPHYSDIRTACHPVNEFFR